MTLAPHVHGFALAIAASATLVASAPDASAEAVTLTDIAGREITLPQAPTRIILGEGRMMYAIAPLTDGNPFEKIVGWKDDLIQYDPDAFRKFEAAFPQDAARMVNFGNPYAGDFSIEAVLENEADLVLLDLGNLFKAEETGLIDKLDKAGVPVAFIDFRQNPTENAIPSMLLLGRVLGEEQNAAEFIDFYVAQMRKVSNVVAGIPAEERPLVVVENAAGWQTDFCCWSFGPYNYGRFVELAGGTNYGSKLANAYSVDLSLEGILTADPDVVIGTGANWAEARPEVTATLLGYEADADENARRIKALAERSGFKDLRAVQEGRMHSIYHQFYNSPYHFIAIQQIAKWLHPADFEDLDPQATFDELHSKFMPYENSGQFWVTLN
ncbi:ABC transporter substrate-binding protein [Roseobacter sp.]|uniref:ABC transporter substrate-binding protein n=1 Tax=Roseobacter sp. TaxID=1907202 RepID=UPI0029662FFF|nr:ABC transporter substrate-binding protein [Roseobacter sp.]MDW3182078.1 ABC transporter substrate-binding protein [Roseobacter sp.]